MEGERGYDREWGERTREWAMRGGNEEKGRENMAERDDIDRVVEGQKIR